jgi:hypothetical protein
LNVPFNVGQGVLIEAHLDLYRLSNRRDSRKLRLEKKRPFRWSQSKIILVTFASRAVGCVGVGVLTGVVPSTTKARMC